MTTINLPLTGIPGRKQMIVLSTTAQDVAISAPANRNCRFQLICNADWLYGCANHGSTADAWLAVAAGQPIELEVGSGQALTAWGKLGSGTANLHILDV